MTPIIRRKISEIANSRQLRFEIHLVGVDKVIGAKILKKGLKIKKLH